MGILGVGKIDFTRMTFTDLLPMALQMFTDGGAKAVFDYLNPVAGVTDTENINQITDALDKIEWEFETITNPLVSLMVNPQNIAVDKRIIYNKTQTKGGFVVQFWGHDLSNITVKSQTGSFALNKGALRAFDVLKRHVYEKRFSSKQSFKGMPIVSMIWDKQIFEGFFQNFNYNFDASKPYIIHYDFVFTITNVLTIPVLSQVMNSVGGVAEDISGQSVSQLILSPLQDKDGKQTESGWGVPLG